MPGLYRRYPPPYPHPQTRLRRIPREIKSLGLVCGAECSLNWDEGSADPLRHWSDRNGTINVSTSVVRSGSRSFEVPANATFPSLANEIPTGKTVVYSMFFMRWVGTLPVADTAFMLLPVLGGSVGTMSYKIATGTINANFSSNTQAGPVITTDKWYGVEIETNFGTNPRRHRWRTWEDGVWTDRTDVTRSEAGSTSNGWNIGIISGTTSGLTIYYDDIHIGASDEAGDFYGETARTVDRVGRLLPNVDGTHAFTAGDFLKSGVSADPANTDLYTYIDDSDQTSTADYLGQAVAGAGKYVRVGFESVPGSVTEVGQATVVSTHVIPSAGSAEHHLRISDDGTNWTNVLGDWSATGDTITSTSMQSRSSNFLLAPSGGTWTPSKLNSLEAEWGNSDDVTPNPRIHSLSIEYEYVEPAAATITPFPYVGGGYFPT